MAKLIFEIPGKKKRKASKGAWTKENHPPGRLKPGQSGNPNKINMNGRPRNILISAAAKEVLLHEVPEFLKKRLKLTGPVTGAELCAAALLDFGSLGNVMAVRELREITEGRLPDTVNIEGTIDYTAGKTAIEMLLSKLEPHPALPENVEVNNPEGENPNGSSN